MGLPVSVHVRGADAASETVVQAVQEFFARLRHLDRVLSPYRPDSDLSAWDAGRRTLDEADPALRTVVELCEHARERTGGYFDARSLPDPTGSGRLRYDPCGLVKGWAVQDASSALAGLPAHGWCVNAGGDVLVRSADDEPPWRVGIEDPADPTRLLTVVAVSQGAVATSGSAHRGSHIVDPLTGAAAAGLRAVTVVGPDLLWSDVYATAAYARGAGALAWLQTLPAHAGMVVDGDGLVRTTAGWDR